MKIADVGSHMHRRLAQIKLASRVLEHELDLAKEGKDVTLDRQLAENLLDTLEIYIEDFDLAAGAPARADGPPSRSENSKPSVTRLN
jgi:hypothetical protein